jgi:hypothetical protein
VPPFVEAMMSAPSTDDLINHMSHQPHGSNLGLHLGVSGVGAGLGRSGERRKPGFTWGGEVTSLVNGGLGRSMAEAEAWGHLRQSGRLM